MTRVRLDTVIDLHSPSTIDSNRGYSMHVYLSAVRLDGVDLELIIITSTDNGPLLPDGSRVHAVGRAVRLGDVVLARNPSLTVRLDADDGQPTALVASMRDLAISDDSAATPVDVVSDGNNAVHMPEPLLLPGQTHLAGFEVLVVPDDPVINNLIRASERMVRFDIPEAIDVDGNKFATSYNPSCA